MRLNEQVLKTEAGGLAAMGYDLPGYDRQAMRTKTLASPGWVHFGAGNIFRAFIAADYDAVVAGGAGGILVAETFDGEIIEKAYAPYDDLCLSVKLCADGSVQKRVVGSVAAAVSTDATGLDLLRKAFVSPRLQIVSFTVTEKGYSLAGPDGKVRPDVAADFAAGPKQASTLLGLVAGLLHARYAAGAPPLALLSLDNCSHNGSLLAAAVGRYAKEWQAKGLVDEGFVRYIQEEIRYPWSMIDKITPGPDAKVHELLAADGWEDIAPLATAKGARTAAYVNAEKSGYLVVEDSFPNGRPPLEKAGFLFTGRDVVDKVERMKVCTCLNPLHTALAIYGCLLGYKHIYDEMRDEDLVRLVRRLGYDEGLPVVTDPGILSPREFIDTVLGERLPNPYMPDTPQRIAADTSQKLPIRFGRTVQAYQENDSLSVDSLVALPLVLAGWCRYLLCVDDAGQPMQPSPDPLLPRLLPLFEDQTLGGGDHTLPEALLRDASIFGVDLVEAGLAERVQAYYTQLCQGPGAVRATLQTHLGA